MSERQDSSGARLAGPGDPHNGVPAHGGAQTIDEAQLRHVARLARIDLAGMDLDRLRGELGRVLDLMQVLERADSATLSAHPAPHMALRPDVLQPSLPLAEVLAHAPAVSEDGGFAVPRVLA